MIILLTTRGHEYTFRSLVEKKFGCPTPTIEIANYEQFFETGSKRLPVATYLFGDLERLTPWELQMAADLYRALTAMGLRCLNDPARAMSRVELLTELHNRGINPFAVYRADSAPRPARFPVFLRDESNHVSPSTELYSDQAALDRALLAHRSAGKPLRGLLVVEWTAERYSDTLWGKWTTWRIGDRLIVEHLGVADDWMVKRTDYRKLTDAGIADEHDAVSANRFAEEIRKSFEIGGIEFGRADHAIYAGRSIVFEINTNPLLSRFEADPRPLRHATQMTARTRIAEALAAIDTTRSGWETITNQRPSTRP